MPLTPYDGGSLGGFVVEHRARHLALGGAGAGNPSGVLGDHSFDVLVHGRREWAVVPPATAEFTKQPFGPWVDGRRSAGREVRRCVQEPGDVIFVPAGWGSANLNLAESVGYGFDFEWRWGARQHWNPKV